MGTQDLIDRLIDAKECVSRMLDRVLYTREEIALRERDKRMQAVFKQGPITNSAAIYQADFGTDCPNGLDIKAYPEHEIHIANLKDMPDFADLSSEELNEQLAKADGMAYRDGHIYMHPHYFDEDLLQKRARIFTSTLAHEHAHTAQFYENDTGWESAFTQVNTTFLHMEEQGGDFKGKTRRLYQKFNQAAVDKDAELKTAYKVSEYFANEHEIQARMHEALAVGYASWQKMPTDKTELWAALHNIGITTPKNILTELKNSDEGQAALKKFKCSRHLKKNMAKVAHDLNLVNDYASFSDVRETLWRKAYPAMYGNLLEHYGDSQGRARMGLGPNPEAAKKITAALYAEPDILNGDRLSAMVADVHPENAAMLINILGDIAEKYPERENKARDIVREILHHKDLRHAVLSDATHDLSQGPRSRPPLFHAVIEGRPEMVKELLDAGADPFHTMKVLDYKGREIHEGNVFGYIVPLQTLEEDLKSRTGFMNKIRTVFNRQNSEDEARREHVQNIRQAFQAIADHYPALDQERTEVSYDGTETKMTARKLLEFIDITPQQRPHESADENITTENHVAFNHR